MGHAPKKRFGQNFLKDENLLAKMVRQFTLDTTLPVIEIGPGLGALTAHLLPNHSPLNAVEIDRDCIAALTERFANDDLIIHQCDALKFDWGAFFKAHPNAQVVGNFPYNISTPLLFTLLAHSQQITSVHALLQQEVVQRLCAVPSTKSYGRLSVVVQYLCHTTPLLSIPPSAFFPAPKVMSQVVRLTPYTEANFPYPRVPFKHFSILVREAFSKRRKTLRNNLPDVSAQVFEQAEIDSRRRAETLSVKEFAVLASQLPESWSLDKPGGDSGVDG